VVVASNTPQDWLSLGWIVSYPLMAVLGAMIFLSAEEIAQPTVRAVAAAVPAAAPVDWATDFANRVEALHRAVLAAPLQASVASEDRQGSGSVRWTHRLLELTVDRERRAEIETTLESLRAIDPGVSLVAEETFNGSQVLVGLDGLLTHTLRVFWSDEPPRPRVGLVIASLGDDLRLARRIIELDAPVSVAVRPFRPFSAQVAELAKMFERDVFLDWSGEDSERRGLEEALATVPGAVGVMLSGSEVKPELLASLRDRGLLAIIPDAAGAPRVPDVVAAAPRVMVIPMDGAVDPSVDAIIRQARSGGAAIGMCVSVGNDELRRMRGLLTRWSEEEIDVVKVSQLFPASSPPPPPAT